MTWGQRAALVVVATTCACSAGAVRPRSWLDGCMRQVTYWVGEALAQRKDPGYDYQHMALVADVYEVERAVQTEALAVQRRYGDDTARRYTAAGARTGCDRVARERAATPAPSGSYGWPQ